MERIHFTGVSTEVLSHEIAVLLLDRFQLRVEKGTLEERNELLGRQVAELQGNARTQEAILQDLKQGHAMEHRMRQEAQGERDSLKLELEKERTLRLAQFDRANGLESRAEKAEEELRFYENRLKTFDDVNGSAMFPGLWNGKATVSARIVRELLTNLADDLTGQEHFASLFAELEQSARRSLRKKPKKKK